MPETPETQFIRTDGVDIAYQVVGSPGQLDLLFIPGWVSHLEMMWELPEFARFLDGLVAMARLICSISAAPGFRTGWRGCRRWSSGPTTSRR
jgi:hypothetical protein